jgi:hypothetical protein
LFYDLFFGLLCLLLILEGHLNETEASSPHGLLVTHDDLVGNLAKLREVLE